jgi:hypothetical protein
MTVGEGAQVSVRILQESHAQLKAENERLKSSGGDGTSGGMEERFKHLESEMSDVKRIVTDIRVTLATIEERSKHTPTRWDVFLMVTIIVGLIGTILKFVPVVH